MQAKQVGKTGCVALKTINWKGYTMYIHYYNSVIVLNITNYINISEP